MQWSQLKSLNGIHVYLVFSLLVYNLALTDSAVTAAFINNCFSNTFVIIGTNTMTS